MRRALFASLLLIACGGTSYKPAATQARFDASSDFFALPFPSDLRRAGNGLDLSAFPNPERSDTLTAYLAVALGDNSGFAGAAPLFVSFTGALDPSTVLAASA